MFGIVEGNVLAKYIPGDPLRQRYGVVWRTTTGHLRITLDPLEQGWDAGDLQKLQRWLEENDDVLLGTA